MSSRPNCFQIVVQHFSEEQYIFYFAGEAPEHAQVKKKKRSLEATKNDGYPAINKMNNRFLLYSSQRS